MCVGMIQRGGRLTAALRELMCHRIAREPLPLIATPPSQTRCRVQRGSRCGWQKGRPDPRLIARGMELQLITLRILHRRDSYADVVARIVEVAQRPGLLRPGSSGECQPENDQCQAPGCPHRLHGLASCCLGSGEGHPAL
jgi:hypothetical protein